MGDDAGNENLAGRQLHLFPDGDFMLVARVGAFDQISLRLYLQDDIDDAIEFEIVSVGPMPAAPAQVIAHAFLRNVPQRVIERRDPHRAAGAKGIKPHADADAIPQRRQPGVVDLQDQAGRDNRLVFDAHRLGDGEHILLVIFVVAIAAIDFEAGRGGRGQEYVLGSGDRDGDVDFLLELAPAHIGDGSGASLHRALLGDLRARRIEQRAAFAGVSVEVGEVLAILALLDQWLSRRRLDVGKAAEAILHVTQPVAAFGIFTLVDDIDAGVALARDDRGDVFGELRVVAGRNALVERKKRQTADVGREDFR